MDAFYAWCVALLGHVVLCRCLRLNRIMLFAGCASVVGVVWLALRSAGPPASAAALTADLMIYACLCEVFIIAIAFTMASVSASLVCRCASGAGNLAELEEHYSPRDMVRLRVLRLLEGGYARQRGEQLELTARGHTVVRLFSACQVFFGHGARQDHPHPAAPGQGG